MASSKANVKWNTLPRMTRDIPSRAGNMFRMHFMEIKGTPYLEPSALRLFWLTSHRQKQQSLTFWRSRWKMTILTKWKLFRGLYWQSRTSTPVGVQGTVLSRASTLARVGGGGDWQGKGIAQWLEHQTRDSKITGLNPCRSGRRVFFSRVDFLCWLLFRYPFHPPCYHSST